ncbi:serine/threonine kinase PKN8 [Plesiocystis pacifica SIR-1]|uniref:Serine/threonine kinase PKN8 n=1 Tax=Plesiocystis pacifica SIR-1 TaxID=391625 RepID=A6GFZ9_9BACT|nr:serine/threonine kinase PKN8 [Plesiocystis pacifica SIR-1]
MREAQALAQISHPNVVPVFEVGSAGERVFVAMEYVRGRTLGKWLAELEAGSEAERVAAVVGRFLGAARGLAAVHEAGLAHRDFKPANVIVGDDGRVRLVDFGLARSTGTGTGAGTWTLDGEDQGELLDGIEIDELLTPNIEEGKLTSTGALLGTPRYMAPEQWQAQRGDSRSDQFSFCVALYHALYGEWPYSAKTSDALSAQMLEGGPTPPPPLAGVPESLRAALLTGLEGEAEERNRDMGTLIEAMEETLRPPQRRQGPMLAVLAVLLVILSVALVRLVVTPEADEGPGLDAWLAELVREREAEAQRVAVVEQVAELEAQGEFERADEAFEAFAGLPANANTNALVRAWMDRAAQLGARDLGERQLAALGEALLESSSEAERRDVLFALARIQAANHDYARLGATLLVLEHEEGNAELLTMRAHEALNRRALDEALEALARPELAGLAARVEPLVRQLDRVTRTGARSALTGVQATAIVDLPGLDLDGDGHGELLFVDEDRHPSLRASGPELRWLSDLELPFEDQSYVWIDRARHEGEGEGAAGPSWVGVHAKDGHALVELTQVDERVVARALTMGPQGRWAAGELFAGPGWEGWEAVAAEPTQRRITGLRGTAGEAERFEPTPSLAALDSYVDALLVTDLDGDGDEELVAGVDGWWAYDVRVFSPGAEPGHFELEARDKLGGLSGMVSFAAPEGSGRWLAVTVPESPPSPRVFSSDAPAGAPPGVYLMRWPGPGQALERVDQLALPTAFEPRAGDLDGDGDDELVVELMDGIAILQPGEALGPTSIRLSGLRGQAIVDLDHDGDDELIVRELETGEVLVLGSGSASLPSLDAPLDPRIPPDPGLEAELRPLWARAETLAMVGLADQSAAMFTKLARLANEDSARSARVRSAALLERSGARERAAALYEQAGVPSSLERALEIYRDLHQFEDARRIAERLAEGGDAAHLAEAQTLRRWAEPETSLDLDLRAALDEGWHIEQPGVLRSEPRGLRVDLLNAPDSVIVHRPFEWDGDHLALEFELTIERLEWGSMLHVDLSPEDEHGAVAGPPLARVRIAATGGGGHYILDRAYNQSLEPGSVHHTPRMRAAEPPPGQRRIRVTLDLLGEAAEGRVRVDSSGGDEAPTSLAYRVPLSPEALAAGRYRLALTTGADSWMRGVFSSRAAPRRGAGARGAAAADPARAGRARAGQRGQRRGLGADRRRAAGRARGPGGGLARGPGPRAGGPVDRGAAAHPAGPGRLPGRRVRGALWLRAALGPRSLRSLAARGLSGGVHRADLGGGLGRPVPPPRPRRRAPHPDHPAPRARRLRAAKLRGGARVRGLADGALAGLVHAKPGRRRGHGSAPGPRAHRRVEGPAGAQRGRAARAEADRQPRARAPGGGAGDPQPVRRGRGRARRGPRQRPGPGDHRRRDRRAEPVRAPLRPADLEAGARGPGRPRVGPRVSQSARRSTAGPCSGPRFSWPRPRWGPTAARARACPGRRRCPRPWRG